MKGFSGSSDRHFRSAGVVTQRPVGGLVKRGFDFAGASLGLVCLGPLLLLIACLVAFADGGPVFQGHLRIGRGGRVFNCLRFRTTLKDADVPAAMQLRSVPAEADGTPDQVLEYDPNVTPVGAVLARLGLDELPQLINILRGDMSIVGPRPVAPGELEFLGSAGEFYMKTRPGLTGPWRSEASESPACAHVPRFARSYAENWSLLGDLGIIGRSVTAACVSRGR